MTIPQRGFAAPPRADWLVSQSLPYGAAPPRSIGAIPFRGRARTTVIGTKQLQDHPPKGR